VKVAAWWNKSGDGPAQKNILDQDSSTTGKTPTDENSTPAALDGAIQDSKSDESAADDKEEIPENAANVSEETVGQCDTTGSPERSDEPETKPTESVDELSSAQVPDSEKSSTSTKPADGEAEKAEIVAPLHCPACRCRTCCKIRGLPEPSDSSDSTDTESSSVDSSSEKSTRSKGPEDKLAGEEDGRRPIVVKTRVGPASRTRKYVKAVVTKSSEAKPAKAAEEAVTSSLSPESEVRPNLSDDGAPEANPSVSSTTLNRATSPVLELSSREKKRIEARKRGLDGSQSDQAAKRVRFDESSMTTQRTAHESTPRSLHVQGPSKILTSSASTEKSSSSQLKRRMHPKEKSPPQAPTEEIRKSPSSTPSNSTNGKAPSSVSKRRVSTKEKSPPTESLAESQKKTSSSSAVDNGSKDIVPSSQPKRRMSSKEKSPPKPPAQESQSSQKRAPRKRGKPKSPERTSIVDGVTLKILSKLIFLICFA